MFTAKVYDDVDFEGMKAEAIGVFVIVYLGGLAFQHHASTVEKQDMLALAIVHLVTYSLFVSTSFKISGGLFNPALTVVLMAFRRIKPITGGFYIVSQLFGSVMAGSILVLVSKRNHVMEKLNIANNAGICGYPKATINYISAIYEVIGTFIVVLVYYIVGVAKLQRKSSLHGITIGSTYFLMILVYGKHGGSANIARMFGPLSLSGNWVSLIFASVGSLIGAALSAVVSEKVILFDSGIKKDESEKVAGIELAPAEIEPEEPNRSFRPTQILNNEFIEDNDANFHL